MDAVGLKRIIISAFIIHITSNAPGQTIETAVRMITTSQANQLNVYAAVAELLPIEMNSCTLIRQSLAVKSGIFQYIAVVVTNSIDFGTPCRIFPTKRSIQATRARAFVVLFIFFYFLFILCKSESTHTTCIS